MPTSTAVITHEDHRDHHVLERRRVRAQLAGEHRRARRTRIALRPRAVLDGALLGGARQERRVVGVGQRGLVTHGLRLTG